MSGEIIKFSAINAISLEYSSDVKEEFQEEYYADNKVCVSEANITDSNNISNSELNGYIQNDKIRKYDMFSLDRIKTDLLSPEVNDAGSNNVKIEDGICPSDIQIKFDNELLFCSHCHEVYEDYCTKCRVLVHILNERSCYNTYNRIRELPKYVLETRESIGYLGIFSLKIIPEDVRFGPFTGLNSIGLPLRIKGGRFVVSDDKSELLNWMQYVNPARNIYEQNLFPFQYGDKLYYCSTRRIQEGEELFVYFGEEYEDNLLKNVEMDFVPVTKRDLENVFACTFCCLGFSSKEYLAEHKAACHSEINEMFIIEELVQCPFCKIYLEAKEYFEHHMDYCSETNDRYSVPFTPEFCELEVKRLSSLRCKVEGRRRRIYKCTRCKFTTVYNADFRHHNNEHYEVKMYKCRICNRRYKAKESLKAHVEKNHADNEGRNIEKYSMCGYLKANIKNIKERCTHSHDSGKHCQCSKCKLQTRDKCYRKTLIKIKHLQRAKYKCSNCDFKTYYRTYLKMHMKTKHLMECNYKCMECEFETGYKSSLQIHIKAVHRKVSDYKCTECEYKTNIKSNLEKHKKTIHLKIHDYNCAECEFKTNYKSNLKLHIKSKHVKEHDYKCAECEYNTNRKSSLKRHMKSVHLKEKDYKCMECEYEANRKSELEKHIKTIHLKIRDYNCAECEYKTNYKSDLEKHKKTIHLKVTDYKCGECEYKTNRKPHLVKHIKTIHLKIRDYKCTECEYKTNYKSHLEKHKKTIHLKIRDYKCAECEYKTNNKCHLENHVKTIHLKIRDYKCAECEYNTNHKPHLVKHIKTIHLKIRDYKCTECEYKTNYKSDLEKHKKTMHLKIRDYNCAECEYKTNHKTNFKKHIKTVHLKVTDYKCAECEYKTNYKSNLERHMKTIHPKESDYTE